MTTLGGHTPGRDTSTGRLAFACCGQPGEPGLPDGLPAISLSE